MRNDKHLALKLRTDGKSYKEISSELGISKSTLSNWFSKLDWSEDVKSKLAHEASRLARERFQVVVQANQARWVAWREDHRHQAIREFPNLQGNPLFVSGLMLYWAEGDNKLSNSMVRLTNTDPRMIKIFLCFAREICKVDKAKIRLALILYPDLKDSECKPFWSKYTGIPVNQFYKTQFIKGSHPTRRLEKGICMVRIGGIGLKEKILTWINLYTEELMRV